MKSGADTYSAAIADARDYIEWQIEPLMPYLRGRIFEVGIGHLIGRSAVFGRPV